MLSDNQAYAQPVRLPSEGTYQAQPVQNQVYNTQAAHNSGYAQAVPVQAQPVQAQPVHAQPAAQNYQAYGQPAAYHQQNYYNQAQGAQYTAQPVQQPIAPVYVAHAPPPQADMSRKYELEIERQRAINQQMHAQNVDRQIHYEQRRRQQEQEEACCCLALSAVCCAAFLAAN